MIARAFHSLYLLLHAHKWRRVRFWNGQSLKQCTRCGVWK